MVSIELDQNEQQRLDQLAASEGQDAASFARRILLDYLDFQALPNEPDGVWAEASVIMAAEIMEPEDWDDCDHGS
jgi:predicted transcriptional regulator